MIPLPLITTPVRPLNERLWSLYAKEVEGRLSVMEKVELDCLCRALETLQDNTPSVPEDM